MLSFESMDKTEDGQTKERTHDPRTTSDRVTLVPLPLRVAELVDMYERAGTSHSDIHGAACYQDVFVFSLLDRSLVDLISKPVFFYPSPSTMCKAHTR